MLDTRAQSIMINQQCSKSQAHAYDSTAITIYGHVLCITLLCVLLLVTCLFVIDMMCACVHAFTFVRMPLTTCPVCMAAGCLAVERRKPLL